MKYKGLIKVYELFLSSNYDIGNKINEIFIGINIQFSILANVFNNFIN